LGHIKERTPKVGKKKQKLLTGLVGFDNGFTKTYFRYLNSLKKKKK
jgi:hypothetical protein